MSIFGNASMMAAQANMPVLANAAMGTKPQLKPTGWDGFLSGALRAAGNFGVGFASGVAAYDPRNPASSIAGGFLGASRDLQTALAIPRMEQEAALKRQQKAMDTEAEQATKEKLATSAANRASIMPDITGISEGIAKPKPAPAEPFEFKIGGFPSAMSSQPTAAERIMLLGKTR
jgi:hypothetical protein